MSPDTFRRILPVLTKTRLAYLQGWGEPLLHPHFMTMLALARKAGCRVGSTTNGMLVDDSMAQELVQSGLDILAFSLVGTTGAYNDRIRSGTRLERVVEAIRRVHEVREAQRKTAPALHVAYMLLRSGLDQLESLPNLLAPLGVQQVVISGLDFLPSRELARESLALMDPGERKEAARLLDWIKVEGARKGLEIHAPLLETPGNEDSCPENIQRAFFISADGAVSPCVYTNIPSAGAASFCGGEERPPGRHVFGNVNETLVPVVWRSACYAAFREEHASGRVPQLCSGCIKLRRRLPP